MRKGLLALFALGALGLAGGAAGAQNAPAPAAGGATPGGAAAGVQVGGNARNQEFNFTDELVQGQLVRPDGETTRVRRRGPGISLIRIREHFVPEMLKSVENL